MDSPESSQTFPGQHRLEALVNDQADQLQYPEAMIVFPYRALDINHVDAIADAVDEIKARRSFHGTVQPLPVSPGPMGADRADERKTPLQSIMARADQVFYDNQVSAGMSGLRQSGGRTPKAFRPKMLNLRPGDLSMRFIDGEGDGRSLRQILRARVQEIVAGDEAVDIKWGTSFDKIYHVRGGSLDVPSRDLLSDMEYDEDVTIPELAPHEQMVHTNGIFEMFTLGKGAIDFDLGARMETFRTLQGSRALRFIDETVADLTKFRLEKLGGKRECEFPEGFLGRADSVVRNHRFEGIDPDSSECFVLMELAARANRFKFELISKWMETAEDTGFNLVEQAEYRRVMPAMAAMDRLFLKMNFTKPPLTSKERKEQGFTNEFAVVRLVDGEPQEVLLHEAYPEEYAEMVRHYQLLVDELDHMGDRDHEDTELARRKHKYYESVLKALQTNQLEDWDVADSLFASQISGDDGVMHIHPFETQYFRHDEIVRAPEIGLRATDLDNGDVQERAVAVKYNMIQYLGGKFGDNLSALQETLHLLAKSRVGVRHFLGSGFELGFPPAGQNLPNEFRARSVDGTDSSLDFGVIQTRHAGKERNFRKVFGDPSYEAQCAPYVDFTKKTEDIAAHELGHTIGLTEATYERVGKDLVHRYLEEWKATTAGVIGNLWLAYLDGQASLTDLTDWIVDHIAEACRFMEMRPNSDMHAYIREKMMHVKLMEDCGILMHDPDMDSEYPWYVDIDRGKALKFFDALTDQFVEVMGLYHEGSAEDVQDFLGQNLQSTDFMEFLFDCVSVENAEEFTPSIIAEVA